MSDIRVTPLPQRNPTAPTVMDRMAAREQNWGVTPAAGNGELAGLVRGLAELNPALHAYGQQSLERDQSATIKRVTEEAKANGHAFDLSQRSASDFAGQPLPSSVPPAYGTFYRDAFRGVLADRSGVDIVAGMERSFAEQRNTPGFEPKAFLAEARATALTGFDPVMATRIGEHITQFESQALGAVEKDRLRNTQETRDTALTTSFKGRLREDMTPEQLAAEYNQYLQPQAAGMQLSQKESAKFLLARVTEMSDRLGGSPEKFNVFDEVDATGIPLIARNPELYDHIQAARERATSKRDKALTEAAQEGNLATMQDLTRQMEADPKSITYDVLTANMGPRAPFRNHDEALAFWNKAQALAAKGDTTAALQGSYDTGSLWLLPKDKQQDVLEANLGPHVTRLSQAMAAGDAAAVSQIAGALMQAQSRAGSSEPLDSLKRFTETLVTTIPNAAGPDARFTGAAALYRALSASPQLRDIYFKDDAKEVLQSFTENTREGGDPKAAYAAAYQAIAPEAKARAAKFVASPEFAEKVRVATKGVQGSSFWPRVMGGNGRPENVSSVQMAASWAVREYLARTPFASDSAVESHVKEWTEKNFVLDTTTGTAVRVPPTMGGQLAQEALSSFSKRLTDRERLNDMSGPDWTVQYLPLGSEGQYQVILVNGSSTRLVATFGLGDIVDAYRGEKVLGPGEHATLTELQRQVKTGTVDPVLLGESSATLAKARALKVPGLAGLDKLNQETMRQRLQAVPSMAFGTPSFDDLQFVAQRGAKVDNKLTAQMAMRFTTEPMMAPGMQHQSLAASLITMGEGAVMQAYPDPAKDAGTNIGMGYNLKANAKYAAKELAMAGVPVEKVQAVIDGTAQLMPDQAARLLKLSLTRYEKRATDAAEKTAPGLWAKMTPTQRAVMIDVAYQVGDAAQFKRAWDAIAKGDAAAFAESSKVFYTNKDGVKVEDKRRNNLRAAMYQGIPQWNAVVSRYGDLPGNALDSLALGK